MRRVWPVFQLHWLRLGYSCVNYTVLLKRRGPVKLADGGPADCKSDPVSD